MHVTSEDGVFTYRKAMRKPSRPFDGMHLMEVEPDEPQVCGVYFLTDPDKVVEVEIEFMDVSCELGGLLGVSRATTNRFRSGKQIMRFFLIKQFVDGWELNGEYFPGIHDHEMSLENRVEEFCDKSFTFKRKANRKRIFTSHQNAAVFQYKIPIQGAFAISVKYLHNPKREFAE